MRPVNFYKKRKMTFETDNESPAGFTFLLRLSGLLCHLRRKLNLSRLLALKAHFSRSAAAVRSGRAVLDTGETPFFLGRRAVEAEARERGGVFPASWREANNAAAARSGRGI